MDVIDVPALSFKAAQLVWASGHPIANVTVLISDLEDDGKSAGLQVKMAEWCAGLVEVGVCCGNKCRLPLASIMQIVAIARDKCHVLSTTFDGSSIAWACLKRRLVGGDLM